MRGLSLTQPWATLVAIGAKQWETRSWAAHYRGEIAIHASKSYPKWAREYEEAPFFSEALRWTDPMSACGSIIAVARLFDVAPASAFSSIAPLPEYIISDQERAFGDYGAGRFAFKLTDVRLCAPFAFKGALGLWHVPDSVAAQIRESVRP